MLFWFCSLVWGTPKLQYEQELENRVLVTMMQDLEQGEHQKVEDTLNAFEKEVFASPRLSYEVGLLYNRLGDLQRALEYYNRALQSNPQDIAALYDRAEIYILQNNTSAAKLDLLRILANQEQILMQSWVIYFRLAQIGGLEGNAKDLERYLLEAIKWDMDLSIIQQDKAQWSKFAKDPRLASALHSIFILMAMEDLWEELLVP